MKNDLFNVITKILESNLGYKVKRDIYQSIGPEKRQLLAEIAVIIGDRCRDKKDFSDYGK